MEKLDSSQIQKLAANVKVQSETSLQKSSHYRYFFLLLQNLGTQLKLFLYILIFLHCLFYANSRLLISFCTTVL